MRPLWALVLLLAATPAWAQQVPEPEDYRMEAYRAPVPESLTGGTVVSTDGARDLAEDSSVLLIDVLPRPPKPKGLDPSILWRPQPRHNIPGSIWLPNVGYGTLSPEMARHFEESLAALSEGDRARILLFYCQANCWMSWNAAKRAIALGYSRVHWYPEGTDGWQAAGLPTEYSEPEPSPEEP
ncbi:MAG: PQQ-dependent catabolism-associated CXXCW motif protein [Pseudomonadota bacterium]